MCLWREKASDLLSIVGETERDNELDPGFLGGEMVGEDHTQAPQVPATAGGATGTVHRGQKAVETTTGQHHRQIGRYRGLNTGDDSRRDIS